MEKRPGSVRGNRGRHRSAVVVGFEYYSRYLAQLMNEHSQDWRMRSFPGTRFGTLRALGALANADALISFGGPAPSASLTELAISRGIPITVIWAGTDVLTAAQSPGALAVIRQRRFFHIADGEWLVSELDQLGIEANYLPVTAIRAADSIAPLPSKLRVLTHLHDNRREFYGEERLNQIAAALPHVDFVVVGAGMRRPDTPSNVAFLGYVDPLAPEIDASTVILRMPDHDGKSMLVLEALARGRHAIWTHEFPHVTAVDDVTGAISAIADLNRRFHEGQLAPNEAGRDFVRERFSRERIAADFERHLDATLESVRGREKPREKRVAISGLSLFSAQVAERVRTLRPDWEPTVLSGNSRMEVLASAWHLLRSDVWYLLGDPSPGRILDLCARVTRKPRVMHWVGSDILQLAASPKLQRKLKDPSISHLTEVAWTRDKLKTIGFASEVAALPPQYECVPVTPLPDDFTLLFYIPKFRPYFYGKMQYENVLRRLADEPIRVIVVGGGDIDAPPGIEVENVGWKSDLTDVYVRTTALVRLTQRDGLSMMVLEAMSHGRHVMWSQAFPYTEHITGEEQLLDHIRKLLDQHRAGTLQPALAAAAMVRTDFSPVTTLDRIVDAWDRAMAPPMTGISSRPHAGVG